MKNAHIHLVESESLSTSFSYLHIMGNTTFHISTLIADITSCISQQPAEYSTEIEEKGFYEHQSPGQHATFLRLGQNLCMCYSNTILYTQGCVWWLPALSAVSPNLTARGHCRSVYINSTSSSHFQNDY